MSRLYNDYLNLKRKDNTKMYLFKVGVFYIFIDEDALKVSKITTLKLTKLNDEIVKCGFPYQKLDKYLELFKNLKLDFMIINQSNDDNYHKIINKIKKIDIEKITPVEAINILNSLKELINE